LAHTLTRQQKGRTPLFLAAQVGHLEAVECLVKELGADPNIADRNGCTLLYVTAEKGHLPVVQCLVKEHGADVNQATDNCYTPLMAASALKHAEIVVWLIKHGADAQASHSLSGTADVSKDVGAPAVQTEYLEARAHCANLIPPAPVQGSRSAQAA
jgi:ankyrin repeat protein